MRSAASHIAIATTLLLAACGGADARVSGPSADITRGPAGDYPMVLGAPFEVDGVTYTPADTLNYDSVGYASQAEGEGVSGAHRTLPLPSYVEVTSLETGRTILVRLTRRGPMTGNDVVSLAPGAWMQLGAGAADRVPVRVRRVNPPEAERALLRDGAQAPARMDTPPGLLAALKRKLGLVVAPPVLPSTPPVAAAGALGPTPTVLPSPIPIPQAKAAVKLQSASRAQASAPPAAEPPAAEHGLFVQAGAYSTRERAEKVARALGGRASAAGKFWRVRTGPHKDRGQADAALANVRAAGYADARVVAAP